MTSVASVVVPALAAAVAGGAAAFHPSTALIGLAALAAVVCAVAAYVHFTRDAANDDADRPVTIVALAVGAALLVAAVVLAGLSIPRPEYSTQMDTEYTGEDTGSVPVGQDSKPYRRPHSFYDRSPLLDQSTMDELDLLVAGVLDE